MKIKYLLANLFTILSVMSYAQRGSLKLDTGSNAYKASSIGMTTASINSFSIASSIGMTTASINSFSIKITDTSWYSWNNGTSAKQFMFYKKSTRELFIDATQVCDCDKCKAIKWKLINPKQ